MNTSECILIHPRCRSCETTYPRRIPSTERCGSCGRVDWVEKHEAAFELILERADGWYGVQDYENVHAGDGVQLLIAGNWRPGQVERLDALGFYVRGIEGGLELEYRSFENEQVLWRWPQGDTGKGWVGPFASREAAESVRHDWAPGDLVCGVCGWDGWKTQIAEHYRVYHGPRSDSDLEANEARRRPLRRIFA
jgi:hypothetical protein